MICLKQIKFFVDSFEEDVDFKENKEMDFKISDDAFTGGIKCLLMGNQDYKDTPLVNPIHDVQKIYQMADSLNKKYYPTWCRS